MRKWTIGLLVVVMVFSLLSVSAFAASGSVTVSFTVDEPHAITFDSKDAGDKEVTVNVSVTKDGGPNIGALDFVVEASEGLTIEASSDLSAPNANFNSNSYAPNWAFTYTAMDGEGQASFNFTFKVKISPSAAKENGTFYIRPRVELAADIEESPFTSNTKGVEDITIKHGADAHTWQDVPGSNKAPTCTADGEKQQSCACGATQTVKDGDKTGHKWELANVVWGEFTAPETPVTVTLTCSNGCGTKIEEQAMPKSGQVVPATCETPGKTPYTGEVTFAEEDDSNTPSTGLPITATNEGNWSVEIPATGHSWTGIEGSVAWDRTTSGDYKASAKAKCGNANCDEKWNENAADCQVTVEPKETPATCEKDGSIVYTATVKSPDGTTEFKEPVGYQETEVLPATGHAWGDMVITEWDKTTSGAWKATKATITCSNEGCDFTDGPTQTVTGTDLETNATTVAPTYETAGSVTYTVTAKFEKDNTGSETLEKTDSKTVEPLPKLKAPAPAAKVESAIVPSQSQGTTEGIITDAAKSVIEKALAGTAVDKSVVDEEVCEAIKTAGTSAENGSLSVSTELVVNDKFTPDAGVAAGVPAGAKFLDIAIKVTVSSTDSTALPSRVEGYIHQVGTPIQFTVPKPAGGPIFYVARYHDNIWEKLETTVGETTLSFKSDKFSTFAVISSDDIADADITVTPQYAYTGAVIRPVVKVTVNGGATELKEGTDYELTVAGDAIQPGDYKLTIKGIGSYTGSVEKTITILTPDATPTPAATAAPTATPVPTEAPATATPAPTAAGTAAPTATKDPNAAPQTGDETPVMLYATMLTVCAAALTLALIFRRRREK